MRIFIGLSAQPFSDKTLPSHDKKFLSYDPRVEAPEAKK
jgi:hypothetical protein